MNALTNEQAGDALQLSVAIARATRGAERAVADFNAQPFTFADALAAATDAAAAWGAWLAPLRSTLAAVLSARRQHARLVALVGPEGTVRDHGWDNGTDQIGVAAIGAAVDAAELLVAPFRELEKSLPKRRAA